MTDLPQGAAFRMFRQLVPVTPTRVAPPPHREQAWWPACLAALVVACVLWLTGNRPLPPGVFYDDAIYLGLARALAHGAGYRHLALPGQPLGVHYPPGYPLWLTLWGTGHWSTPLPVLTAWLLRGNAVLCVLAAALWVRWGTRVLHLPALPAVGAVIAALLCVPARAVVTVLFSEPLGWVALAVVALLTAEFRWRANGPPIRVMLFTAGIVGLLPLVRSAFLPMAVGTLLVLGWDIVSVHGPRSQRAWSHQSGQWARVVLLLVVLLTPSAAWALWSHRYAALMPMPWRGNYGTYAALWQGGIGSLADMTRLAARQARDGWRIATVLLGGAVGASAGLIVLVVGAMNAALVAPAVVLGLAGYGVLVALWPVEPDRFVWGVLPLLALLMARGTISLLATVTETGAATDVRGRYVFWRRAASLVTVGGACAGAYAFVLWNVPGYRHDPPGWRTAGEAEARAYAPSVRWVQAHHPAGALASPNDALLAALTGRTVMPALPADPGSVTGAHVSSDAARLRASLCVVPVGWLVLPVLADPTARAAAALARDSAHAGIALTVADQLVPSGLVVRYRCSALPGVPVASRAAVR